MPLPNIRLATAHISPSYSFPRITLTKILASIHHASLHNATLLALPESLLPGFPIWSALLPPSHPSTHNLFKRFSAHSIYADGPEVAAICDAARKGRVSVSIGVSEKMRGSEGTLWNGNLLIDEEGRVRVKHRKIAATWFERLVWGRGDGEGLRSVEVGVREVEGGGGVGDKGKEQQGERAEEGEMMVEKEKEKIKIGALICGENTNPLARYAVMSQGQHVHVSSWPAVWPTRMPMLESPATDQSSSSAQGKNYDNILANRIRAAAHCFEAKCYGIMSAACLSRSNIDELTSLLPPSESSVSQQFSYALQHSPQAASMILSPTGVVVPGFIIKEDGRKEEREMLRDEEGVLFADVDLSECVEGKQFHDLVGGYQRNDIFELRVDRRRKGAVRFVDG